MAEFHAIIHQDTSEEFHGDQDYVTVDQFKKRYGDKVIKESKKVKTIIKQVEEEIKHGISNGHISFDDFSYMYMFLEFDDKKKHKDKKVAGQ